MLIKTKKKKQKWKLFEVLLPCCFTCHFKLLFYFFEIMKTTMIIKERYRMKSAKIEIKNIVKSSYNLDSLTLFILHVWSQYVFQNKQHLPHLDESHRTKYYIRVMRKWKYTFNRENKLKNFSRCYYDVVKFKCYYYIFWENSSQYQEQSFICSSFLKWVT